ncbi:LETM1 domain-containing protein 1-like isoform X2 [Clupea harengus]|uniref:LETM1 domain-containing protein 1-like isoform X2 n=1 Tax=Clupea harengus TaxID=7950 RepID=A0A8M1KN30_CLUHA|nr:LETM1 domain-containing protein 1-like isoform X2 [Clupea harengus]
MLVIEGPWTRLLLYDYRHLMYSTSHVRQGLLQRANDQVERFLEHRFPAFYIYYHTFMKGSKVLLQDLIEARKIKVKMNTNGIAFKELPYREMERLRLVRKDIIKAIPMFLISLPPFAICLVFTLMYLFPRQLLFHHFWTPQQQRDFKKLYHEQRARHHYSILMGIESTAPHVEKWMLRSHLLSLCTKVQSGTHPSVSDLLVVQGLFTGHPLGLYKMRSSHMRLLSTQLLLTPWLPAFMARRRMSAKALEMLHLDRALRDLGVNQLSDSEVDEACDLRGLDTSRLSFGQCREWLQQWLQLSSHVKESETSLLLHSMVLLSVNYPSP